jgi:predicted HTH transcriptional regulator
VKPQQRLDIAIARFVTDMEALLQQAAKEAVLAALKATQSSPARRGKEKEKEAEVAEPDTGRRVRRSAAQLAEVQSKIVKLLQSTPKLTSEEIQEKLGLSKEDIQRPLQLLRDEDKVKAIGERRSMRYFVGAGKPGVIKRVKREAAE